MLKLVKELKHVEEDEEEKVIIQPSASSRHKFMLEREKAKLEHPRRILWKWLFSYLKPFRLKFTLFLCLLLIGTVITSVTPLLIASIIDNGIIKGNTNYIQGMSGIYLFLMIFMAISNYISLFGMGKISQKITFYIRNDLFFKLQTFSLNSFDKRSSGDVISIATNDVTILNQLVGGQFIQIINNIVLITLTVFFLFILNPFLALISLLIFPLSFSIATIFKKVAIKLFKASRRAIGKVTSSIQENIAGAKVMQAYGQEKRASSEFDKANKENYNIMIKIRKFMATLFPLLTLVTVILTAIVLLAGGFAALGNVSIFGITVTVGVLSAYIAILGQLFKPFMSLMQIQQVIEAAMAASDRIYSLLDEKVEILDPKNPKDFVDIDGDIKFETISFGYTINNNNIKKTIKTHPYVTAQSKSENIKKQKNVVQKIESMDRIITPERILMMVEGLERNLRSSNKPQQSGGMNNEGGGMMGGDMDQMSPQAIIRMLASISIPIEIYEGIPNIIKDVISEQKKLIEHEKSKGYILKDFSLKVPAGTTLAIVGETGAGKSTLIKLIARFYNLNKGKISIDQIDIKKALKKDLREKIGIVPQDAFLFTGTIRENLLYAYEDPTPEIEEKMINISKFLGLHNFIETLHRKYDTKLKENGSNISIGQRQLIAFARALITDPKILVLDEATSSVDPYTETLIQDALDKARKGRTTIIIAHRLSTIKNADVIIVLSSEKKGIIEQGDHESLIAQNGIYKRLIEMQHRDVTYSD